MVADNRATRGAKGFGVSIVTVVLNRVDSIERTLTSVLAQRYPRVEYIVADGGSTDGTLDILARYADDIDRFVGGPDGGIADAMNRALASATGDLVLFLHADDHFATEDSLGQAMTQVVDLGHIWAFDILFGSGDDARRVSPRAFNAWTWFKNPLPHQGVLCPRELFNRLGGFDTTLRIAMDYDFWLRAYRAGIPLRRIKQVLAVMGDGGVSSRRDWPGLATRFSEERLVQSRHASNKPWRWCYSVYWPTYLAYRRLRCRLSS